jgi:hypothetical protein
MTLPPAPLGWRLGHEIGPLAEAERPRGHRGTTVGDVTISAGAAGFEAGPGRNNPF